MSCHGCAAKFGFWTKESGCPACGFSFCNNCLKNKCAVPKLNNKVCKVCKSCSKSISNPSAETTGKEMPSYGGPPDVFLKRLEALETPKPPVIMYRVEPRMRKLIEGMNSTDLEIVRRLEKLRAERQAARSVPTEDELARRLALLKGQDVGQSHSSSSNINFAPDNRSTEQQTQDLFTQFKEEVEMVAKITKPEDEIAERLQRLRNCDDLSQPPHETLNVKDTSSITLDDIAQLLAQCKMEAAKSGKQPDLATVVSLEKLRDRISKSNEKTEDGFSSDEDDDKAAAKILTKVQAEVDLERSLGIVDGGDDDVMDVGNDDVKELPWCIICNEDANVRCLGCDRDLFCRSCFQEGHMDEDSRSHVFELYKK